MAVFSRDVACVRTIFACLIHKSSSRRVAAAAARGCRTGALPAYLRKNVRVAYPASQPREATSPASIRTLAARATCHSRCSRPPRLLCSPSTLRVRLLRSAFCLPRLKRVLAYVLRTRVPRRPSLCSTASTLATVPAARFTRATMESPAASPQSFAALDPPLRPETLACLERGAVRWKDTFRASSTVADAPSRRRVRASSRPRRVATDHRAPPPRRRRALGRTTLTRAGAASDSRR